MRIDRAEECSIQDEFSSFRVGVAGITDASELRLDVLVLLDGVPKDTAADALALVDSYYEPLKIDVVLTYRKLPPAPGTSIRSTDLIQLSKDAVGGERPAGIDVVYTLTSKEFEGATAGRADCIGGIKYPHRAFAVGEHHDKRWDYPPLTFQEEYSAKIAAHEIGHVLGSAHEYANCAEGSDADPAHDAGGVCTVMFNDVGLIGSKFGTLEGAVARGYAEDYVTE